MRSSIESTTISTMRSNERYTSWRMGSIVGSGPPPASHRAANAASSLVARRAQARIGVAALAPKRKLVTSDPGGLRLALPPATSGVPSDSCKPSRIGRGCRRNADRPWQADQKNRALTSSGIRKAGRRRCLTSSESQFGVGRHERYHLHTQRTEPEFAWQA